MKAIPPATAMGRNLPVGAESRRGARYILIGAGLYAIDYAVFAALVFVLGWHPATAQFASRTTGAIAGYYGHRNFTFRDVRRGGTFGLPMQWSGYAAVSCATIVASPLFIAITMRISGGRELFAKVLAEPLLVLCSYIGMRLVFGARRREVPGD